MSERPPQTESELIDFVRSIDVRAPEELHRRIDALVEQSAATPRRSFAGRSMGLAPRRWRLGGALAAVAAAALLLVLGLTGKGASPLTVRQASALTLAAATMAAPGENSQRPTQLDAAVDGVSFPYWGYRFGWRASGARSDRIGGRAVRTVFYSDARGQRIGYAIVAGTPAPELSDGVVSVRGGVSYRFLAQDGSNAVVWLRDGHLCVLAGRGVANAALLALASWGGRGSTAT